MKVILLAKVRGLGDINDVKEVADGYARNFLFPHHLAVQASAKSVADLEAHKKRQAKLEAADLQRQQSVAERLDGVEVALKEKTNDEGVLYAAVGSQKIVDSLKKMGFEITKDQIIITKPIKEVGEHEVTVKFRHGLEATVNIVVST